MAILTVIIGGVLGGWLLIALVVRWNEMKYKKKELPPGTMGWPFFGETTDFLKQGHNFMKTQRARYGSFFKTHILGSPTIISMDPEVNRFILMNESKGVPPGYPKAMVDILGRSNISAIYGDAHKYMRGTLLSLISPTTIKDQILPKTDTFMRTHLAKWANQIIDIQAKTKEMVFLSSLNQIAGIESSSPLSKELIMAEFFKVVIGTLSLPINLPFTNYHRGLQARKNIIRMLEELIEHRRKSQETHEDMLYSLMKGVENKPKLSDAEIIDHIITILNSGFETVSTTSMMALKYLHDHPRVLEELREEHMRIRERKKAEDPLDWNDIKSMRFTRAVILETTRLATIVNGVLRRTTKEMELEGYIIPKGWKIYVYTREINYDPYLYPDPYTFNPWRWLDKPLETDNHFFVFGAGTRRCPGKELGIAEISTFLHYFVTKYRWEEIGEDKIIKFPRVEAPTGLLIKVSTY